MKSSPVKDNNETVIISDNPVESIAISPMRRPRISNIVIDMAGWDNGRRPDRPPVSPERHPYTVYFEDAKGVKQKFTADNVNSNTMGDMLKALRDSFGAWVSFETFVDVIIPYDCLGNYDKPGALPYGCTHSCRVADFNKRGMDELPVGVTYQGPCGARLESVLDELCHQYVIMGRAETLKGIGRGPRFQESVYNYYDKDVRNSSVFQRYIESCPRDRTGGPYTGKPDGVDPLADQMEV